MAKGHSKQVYILNVFIQAIRPNSSYQGNNKFHLRQNCVTFHDVKR